MPDQTVGEERITGAALDELQRRGANFISFSRVPLKAKGSADTIKADVKGLISFSNGVRRGAALFAGTSGFTRVRQVLLADDSESPRLIIR